MALQYVYLPLYTDADYNYNVTLENVACTLRLYYNERVGGWYFELSEQGANMIVCGERVVPLYPITLDYSLSQFSGWFWLEPIGGSINKFESDSFNLSTWFRFWYIRDDGL